MNREEIFERLRAHAPELKSAGITRLSLFGSMARGERGNGFDLMAEFEPSPRLTLMDMAGLEIRLAEIVGMPVDRAPVDMLKEPVRSGRLARRFLPFSGAESYLQDIYASIEAIDSFIADMSFDEFVCDSKTVAAVERKLLVISEAAPVFRGAIFAGSGTGLVISTIASVWRLCGTR